MLYNGAATTDGYETDTVDEEYLRSYNTLTHNGGIGGVTLEVLHTTDEENFVITHMLSILTAQL